MLSPRQAVVVHQKLRQGYTVAGIAQELGCEESEVREAMRQAEPACKVERAKQSKAKYRKKTETELAVALLRREGHDERVIRANFPEA